MQVGAGGDVSSTVAQVGMSAAHGGGYDGMGEQGFNGGPVIAPATAPFTTAYEPTAAVDSWEDYTTPPADTNNW